MLTSHKLGTIIAISMGGNDAAKHKLNITAMTQEIFNKNKEYLESNDVKVIVQGLWDNKPFSAEIECYTPAGEDMIIDLEELSRDALQEYIDSFDINENVSMWWPNGQPSGVPFSNIKEHYEDYEEWLDDLERISEGMA